MRTLLRVFVAYFAAYLIADTAFGIVAVKLFSAHSDKWLAVALAVLPPATLIIAFLHFANLRRAVGDWTRFLAVVGGICAVLVTQSLWLVMERTPPLYAFLFTDMARPIHLGAMIIALLITLPMVFHVTVPDSMGSLTWSGPRHH